MINLIPQEGQKIIRREYRLRVLTVAFYMYGFVLLLLAVACIPSYVLINAQISTFAEEVEHGVSKDTAFLEAEEEVTLTRDVLSQLKSSPETLPASTAIREMQKLAGTEILFKTFSTEVVNGVMEKIHVQGIAPTRASLVLLKNAIEASEFFEGVEVPISDLARDINVPFSLTVTISKEI